MTKPIRSFIAAAALTTVITIPAQAELIYGLSGTNIVSFDSALPGTITATRAISGLNAGDSLLSIDVRPQDGLLYAYSTQSRIYNFNLTAPAAAVATQVVGPFTTSTANGAATLPVSTLVPTGNVIIDFNPQANALRIEDSNDGNYRLPFATAPTTGSLIGDGQLRITAPPDFGIAVAVAYTNNFAGTTSTALFALEATNNALYQQTSPNNGTMVLIGSNVGPGIDIPTSGVGFDVSGTGAIFASFANGGVGPTLLYTLSTATGTVGSGTAIGATVTDIAVATVVPEPGSITLLAGGMLGLFGLRRRRQS